MRAWLRFAGHSIVLEGAARFCVSALRRPAARRVLVLVMPDRTPPSMPDPSGLSPESLERYKHWKPEYQQAALDRLRQIESSGWEPFYCKNRQCDGEPHEGFEFPHAREDQRPPRVEGPVVRLAASVRAVGQARPGPARRSSTGPPRSTPVSLSAHRPAHCSERPSSKERPASSPAPLPARCRSGSRRRSSSPSPTAASPKASPVRNRNDSDPSSTRWHGWTSRPTTTTRTRSGSTCCSGCG